MLKFSIVRKRQKSLENTKLIYYSYENGIITMAEKGMSSIHEQMSIKIREIFEKNQKESGKMSVERLYEKARLHMGATEEERLRKARARTVIMTKILAMQAKRQEVTEEMLNRKCTI